MYMYLYIVYSYASLLCIPFVLVLLKALFEYNAGDEEELSFPEGASIKLLRTDDNGIDDGWWEGCYQGKVGVFPSVVVEVVKDDISQVRDNKIIYSNLHYYYNYRTLLLATRKYL